MSDYLLDTVLIIKKALYRERKQKILLLFFVLNMACVLFYAAVLQAKTTLYGLCTIASLIALVSSLLLLRDILKFWHPESSPLLQMIVQAPKNIVWIYQVNVRFSPFGINFRNEISFCFRLINGDMLQIRIPEKDSVKLMNMLEGKIKNASFGYSREKEQLYGIHPELLQKD